MAAVASAADQATELLQKLSMESKSQTHDAHEAPKKLSGIQFGSANAAEAPKFQVPSFDRSLTPVLPEYGDQNLCYLPNGYPSTAYYYGAFDGSVGEWDYSRYPEGVEMPHGVYGDMYHHGYGYVPYSSYHPSNPTVPSLGHDSQIYGAQHYQYPSPYFQPQTSPNGAYSSNNAVPEVDNNASSIADKPPFTVESAKPNLTGVSSGSANNIKEPAPPKQNQQNSSVASNGIYGRGVLIGGHPSSGYQDPRFSFDGMRSPVPWFDGTTYSDAYVRSSAASSASSPALNNASLDSSRSQNARSAPQIMGYNAVRPTPSIMNRMYSANRMYGQCGNTYRSGAGFGSNMYDSRINDRWGFLDNKYKPRVGQGNGFFTYGNENFDGLSELNRGPRANRLRNFKNPTTNAVTITQSLPENAEDPSVVPNREQYNRANFSYQYSDAKFFVIKSYSEDDIHKSIKYSVWASTPNGNKKLNCAFKEAQEKEAECPVFLFFSVNTSGQFVGVAEMVGPVDFDKTVDYWQQDKWNGCFNVKWHIVKDVPNSILKHITIENNDNKPVTNSRDTQEVKLEQGLEILKIFKEHASKSSILDDFSFYETRQKVMQEKRSKQQLLQQQESSGRLMVEIRTPNSVDDKGKKDCSNLNAS